FNSDFKINGNEAGIELPENYDPNKTIIIDPFVTGTGNLTGINNGIAKDIDFDYSGNIYVTGGGDGVSHKMAKYDAAGVLQWTFSGTLINPVWSFGTYYGGWVVDKTSGSVYLGQGFEYIHGFSIIRLTTTGLYDNYISTPNPSFRENWKMFWNCNNGSPQILIAGGGTNANTNFGICSPPSTTISSLNITGIPYTGIDGWAQDISDLVIDPVTNDMYTIYGSLYGTPSLSNKIYKNKPPYSSASIAWNTYSGFVSVQEIANRPYLLTSEIDNSSNVLAVNSSYFFYWDGKNLKAFDKATGIGVGAPLTVAANTTLMYGGIIADECNNIFVGSSNGTIKVFKFTGALFDDAAAPDITIPGFNTNAVYDLAYNEAQKLLYASGNGFVASFDISSYGCPATSYTLAVAPNCAAGSAVVTISPAPPVGSTVTYVLYNGTTQIASNSSGVFTGLSAGITYTVKVYVNQVCSGTLTVTNFVLPGPALAITYTDATCANATGSITAAGSLGTAPYTYSKDGITFQGSGGFTGLVAGLYIITVKDAGGCKTSDSIIIKNTDGPSLSFTKTDALCGNNNGSITATGTNGTAPYQYSINGITYQSSNIFNGLGGGNYTLIIKDANGCINVASVIINSNTAPQVSALGTAATCNNSNGSITITAKGGMLAYQYSIDGNTYQTNNIFQGMSAGTYTAFVKDANGCIGSVPVTITNSAGPTITAIATTAVCNNVNGSITATGSGGAAPLMYSINGTT
ncbi:MAG TPA: SprB repeat-containing protein, partial [Panacibacter sp.]|nr:SprB repeat-containing protein [Panacibacter sp.]